MSLDSLKVDHADTVSFDQPSTFRRGYLIGALILLAVLGGDPPAMAADPPDLAKPVEVVTLKGHARFIRSIVFTQDGTKVVTGSSDGTARVWDAKTGKELHVLRCQEYGDVVAALSPDGTKAATAYSETKAKAKYAGGVVRVWNAKTGTELISFPGDPQTIQGITFSPDGSRIATAGTDGGVFKNGGRAVIFDAATGKELLTLKGHTLAVRSIAYSSDGSQLLTLDDGGKVHLWNAKSGEEMLQVHTPGRTVFVSALSSDATRLVIGGNSKCWVYDTKTGKEVLEFKAQNHSVVSVAFSPCGSRILTGSHDGTARVWETKSGRELLVIPCGEDESVRPTLFTPDGTRVAVGLGRHIPNVGHLVKIWEIAAQK